MILSFYLHFTWLCGSWNHQRLFEKQTFWRNDSWFPLEVSKLTSVKYPWNQAFSGMKKNYFHQYCPILVIALTKCRLYCIQMIFWSLFGTITYPTDIFCFHESIFQWQIKLISYRSDFWHLRRKSVVIFSKWMFFQNSLVISWAM